MDRFTSCQIFITNATENYEIITKKKKEGKRRQIICFFFVYTIKIDAKHLHGLVKNNLIKVLSFTTNACAMWELFLLHFLVCKRYLKTGNTAGFIMRFIIIINVIYFPIFRKIMVKLLRLKKTVAVWISGNPFNRRELSLRLLGAEHWLIQELKRWAFQSLLKYLELVAKVYQLLQTIVQTNLPGD